MAQVWCARLRGKHGFEKLLAIKTILPKFASDPQFQSMFLDEARLASGIQHANVAQILDLGDEQGVLYIAMEWVDGDALTKLSRAVTAKKQRIPMSILLRIVADTCGGLHAAHELRGKDGALLGLVHRDVSPHNVLVDGGGVVKLIDFGIAKARDRSTGETSTGTLKGKIHYMAPEQAVGAPVDRRADVWAIGSILYHYLCGRPPFDAPSQVATLHQLTKGTPPLPPPPDVPREVAAIVMRALEHNREKRQETAAALQASIEAAMLGTGLVATSADVGAFVREHLGERAARRKAAIDAALTAATDRDTQRGTGEPWGVRWLSPEENEKQATPYSVPTEAALGVGSTIGPVKKDGKRSLLVALVGVLGIGLGVGSGFALRARSSEPAVEPAVEPESTPAAVASSVPSPPPPPPPTQEAPPPVPEAAVREAPSRDAGARPAVTPRPASPAAPPRPSRPASTSKIPSVIDNGF